MKIKVFVKNYFVNEYHRIEESNEEFIQTFELCDDLKIFFDGLYNAFELSNLSKVIYYFVEKNELLVYNNDGSLSFYFVEDLPF